MKKLLAAMVLLVAIAAFSSAAYWLWQDKPAGEQQAAVTPDGTEPEAPAAKQPQSLTTLFPRTEEFDFEAPVPGTYELPILKLAGDGNVIDHDGRESTLFEEFDGKISLLSFIYTSCNDADGCPLATGLLFEIFHASEQSPELAANTKLVTLSFDPSHDTPAMMKVYGQSALEDEKRDKKMQWRFLTSSSNDQLQPILDKYSQAVNLAKDNETINHLLRLYLIDRKGRIRNVYGLGFMDPRLLLADIETLLMEEAQEKGS